MGIESETGLPLGSSEHAEPPAADCAACGNRLFQTYYQVGDKAMCEKCKADVELAQGQGSGFGRFARATVFGGLAGGAGAALWYGVRALTGYEVGLISIAVGLMVGAAVKAGCRGRGGRLYQFLAVSLTYVAIVSTYVPYIIEGFTQNFEQAESASAAEPSESVESDDPASPPLAASLQEAPVETEELSPGELLVAASAFAALVFALSLVAPFLAGFENLVGILIIGFGLWEAWKINAAQPLVILGPYRVVAATPSQTG